MSLTIDEAIVALRKAKQKSPLGGETVICLCETDREYIPFKDMDLNVDSDGALYLMSLHKLNNKTLKSEDHRPLIKTTIVIWSEPDCPTTDLAFLAREAMEGEAYCSKMKSKTVENPQEDPDWDGNEFFTSSLST